MLDELITDLGALRGWAFVAADRPDALDPNPDRDAETVSDIDYAGSFELGAPRHVTLLFNRRVGSAVYLRRLAEGIVASLEPFARRRRYAICDIEELFWAEQYIATPGRHTTGACTSASPPKTSCGCETSVSLCEERNSLAEQVLLTSEPAHAAPAHLAPAHPCGLVAFHYTPSWKAKHPVAWLQSFTGLLQGDGYAGFAAMLRDDNGDRIVPEERRLGCAMHIRAKFEKAAQSDDAHGAVGLAYFKAIYRIEASPSCIAGSPTTIRGWCPIRFRTPTQLALNQEQAWRRCFTYGRFEIDNGEVERQLRRVPLDRKNYLFAGSDKGAKRLAVGYTVFGSRHARGQPAGLGDRRQLFLPVDDNYFCRS